MASFFRHLSTSLLCAVMALGHAPAWLHVATCDDSSCGDAACGVSLAVPTTPAVECECHGHHHEGATDQQVASTVSTADSADPVSLVAAHGLNHSHHSGSCSICQSLATPCGFADEATPSCVFEPVCERIIAERLIVEIASPLLLPPSRGPPTLVV